MSARIFHLLLLFSFSMADDCLVTLTSSNFSKLVINSPHSWLIMFVDEHCSYCKEILPLWNEAAEVLCMDSTYIIGTVHLESNKDLQYQFNIDTSLVFKLIKDNRVYTFDLSYPVQDLIHFAKYSNTLQDRYSVI